MSANGSQVNSSMPSSSSSSIEHSQIKKIVNIQWKCSKDIMVTCRFTVRQYTSDEQKNCSNSQLNFQLINLKNKLRNKIVNNLHLNAFIYIHNKY